MPGFQRATTLKQLVEPERPTDEFWFDLGPLVLYDANS